MSMAENAIRRLWPRRHESPHTRALLRLVVRDLRLWRSSFSPGGKRS